MAGQTVHCPGCGGRIDIPKNIAPTPMATGSLGAVQQQRGGWPESDPSNVHPWKALGIGMIGMVVALLILFPIRKTFVGDVYWSGSWINHSEFFLFFWGLGILFLKYKKTQQQHDAMLLDVLPKKIGATINPANVGLFIDHLYKLPERLRDSMMVNRIRKGLELFEARTNNSEVATIMSAQSNVDANRIAGSYALLKVFLWAIPILGFIGTVLGLSFAMAGFGSVDLTDMGAMKGAVSSITSGLATAFNTTLLGLILSMVLIFPMSTMQKREEDCLNEIDAFCNEKVLPRLDDGSTSSAAINQLVTNPAAFAQMLSDFATAQQQLVEDMRQVTGSVQELASGLEARASQHQQRVEEQFGEALNGLMLQTADAVSSSAKSVERYVGGLSTGIEGLNKALVSLGERQITVQEVPKRGGWFGGGKKEPKKN